MISDVLQALVPVLRYAKREGCFADDAEQAASGEGQDLRRADGTLIAREPGLAFLGRFYPSGERALGTDLLGRSGHEYLLTYQRICKLRPEWRDAIYGSIVTQDGASYALYWRWHFYNEVPEHGLLDRLPIEMPGDHWGDFEPTLFGPLDESGSPVAAFYGQHRLAQSCPWSDVEKADGHPVVYVAEGTHAAYFRRGTHRTDAWRDYADGEGREIRPRLLELGPWANWPGRWGRTPVQGEGTPRKPWLSSSPPGPARQLPYRKPADWAATSRPLRA